jgi:toxin ParE1/3/4
MAQYSLSPLALEDLREIWRYGTAQWGLDKAEQYGEKLLDTFDFLAGNPLAGQPVQHTRDGYRKHLVGSHIIYYRLGISACVEIIRILHQRMDTERHLQDSPY